MDEGWWEQWETCMEGAVRGDAIVGKKIGDFCHPRKGWVV
jgi:hypothetical protein